MFSVLACAVSAMLCEVVFSGVSSRVRSDGVEGEEVKGDMEFDVVLGQSELTEKALQLCHLLPPGIMPVSLYSYHTNPHPVCLIQWMFNGAEQPFILLCCLYLSQREVLDCVGVCISLNAHASSGWLQGLRIWATNIFPFCEPTFHFSNCSFLSPLLVALFLTPFLTKKYLPQLSASFQLPLVLPVWSSLHLYSKPYAFCQLSPAVFLRTVIVWSCFCFWLLHHQAKPFSLSCSLQPCQSAQSFALDAVDSLVRCGILIMEEVRTTKEFWKLFPLSLNHLKQSFRWEYLCKSNWNLIFSLNICVFCPILNKNFFRLS